MSCTPPPVISATPVRSPDTVAVPPSPVITTKRFSSKEDIALLQECLNLRPYAAAWGKCDDTWASIAANVSEHVKRKISSEAVRKRFKILTDAFKSKELASLRKSGLNPILFRPFESYFQLGEEEDVEEREELLQDVLEDMEEHNKEDAKIKAKVNAVFRPLSVMTSAQVKAEEIKGAKQAREAAQRIRDRADPDVSVEEGDTDSAVATGRSKGPRHSKHDPTSLAFMEYMERSDKRLAEERAAERAERSAERAVQNQVLMRLLEALTAIAPKSA